MELLFLIAIGAGAYFIWKKGADEGSANAELLDEITGKKSKKDKKKKKKDHLVSPHDLPTCYGYILDLLNESYRTKPDASWSLTKAMPDEGRIVARIAWAENFGPPMGYKQRRIVLSVDLVPKKSGKTKIYLNWDVESPIHRGQVNEVIDTMTKAIEQNLEAS